MSEIDPTAIRIFPTREEANSQAVLARVTLGPTAVEECDGGFRVGIVDRRGRVTAYLAKEAPH